LHESAINVIHDAFVISINGLTPNVPDIRDYLFVRSNQDTPYADGRGFYVPDLLIRANRRNMFQVEVAFTQTYSNVCSKIARVLQNESILSVLLVQIKDEEDWPGPGRKPSKEDKMTLDDWYASVQRVGNFGAISNKDIVWMNGIKVFVALFEQGWNESINDPPMVRCPFISFESMKDSVLLV